MCPRFKLDTVGFRSLKYLVDMISTNSEQKRKSVCHISMFSVKKFDDLMKLVGFMMTAKLVVNVF